MLKAAAAKPGSGHAVEKRQSSFNVTVEVQNIGYCFDIAVKHQCTSDSYVQEAIEIASMCRNDDAAQRWFVPCREVVIF